MLLRVEPPANGQYMVAAYVLVAVVLLMPRGILGVLQQKYNLPRTI